MAKLTPVPYSRGTKLSANQVSANVVPARGLLQTPTVDAENLARANGRFDVALPIPSIHARLVEDAIGRLAIPVPLLPLQDEWDASLTAGPNTPRPRLRSISIAIDQRASGVGIADYYSGEEGQLTATDMSRYDTSFSFISKPLAMLQSGVDRYARNIKTLWETTLPGVDLLGQPDGTPVLFDNLDEQLDPYSGHWLVIRCPGLFTADPAKTTCALPALFVVLSFDRVLCSRDVQSGLLPVEVQNAPIPNTLSPTPITLTLPSSNQLATQAHTQGNYEAVDAVVAARLEAGWGNYGDLPPREQTTVDSSYSVVAIPLWAGWEDARQQSINVRGFPYTTGPGYVDPTADRRVCPLPDGFVIHHCLLWRSLAGFPCLVTGGFANPMSSVVAPSFEVLVGLGLVEGWDTENTRYQQAAYLGLVGPDLSGNTVDLLGQFSNLLPYLDGVLHYVPLVYPVADPSANGFFTTGKPIYVGRGKRRTATSRMPIGVLPNGAPYAPPVTEGQETHVEARWVIQDTVLGLGGGAPDSYVLGYGGGILFVVGKMPLANQDLPAY